MFLHPSAQRENISSMTAFQNSRQFYLQIFAYKHVRLYDCRAQEQCHLLSCSRLLTRRRLFLRMLCRIVFEVMHYVAFRRLKTSKGGIKPIQLIARCPGGTKNNNEFFVPLVKRRDQQSSLCLYLLPQKEYFSLHIIRSPYFTLIQARSLDAYPSCFLEVSYSLQAPSPG